MTTHSSPTGARAFMPTGAIVAFWGTKEPEGWLMCDGEPIDQEYKDLRDLVGNQTPDLRGYFLRGYDSTGAIDADRIQADQEIGSVQPDEFKGHLHTTGCTSLAEGQPTGRSNDPNHAKNLLGYHTAKGVHNINTQLTGGSETRPKNVAVNFIIKW
ncbi:MAG: phage tail protein [Phycisphaerales bacterium JB038]